MGHKCDQKRNWGGEGMKQHEVNIKKVTGMVRDYVPSTISWSFQDNSDRPLNMSTDTSYKGS